MSLEKAVLRGWIILLANIEGDSRTLIVKVYHWKGRAHMEFNILYTTARSDGHGVPVCGSIYRPYYVYATALSDDASSFDILLVATDAKPAAEGRGKLESLFDISDAAYS